NTNSLFGRDDRHNLLLAGNIADVTNQQAELHSIHIDDIDPLYIPLLLVTAIHFRYHSPQQTFQILYSGHLRNIPYHPLLRSIIGLISIARTYRKYRWLL